MDNTFVSGMITVAQLVTPFLVLFLGWRFTVAQKRNDAQKIALQKAEIEAKNKEDEIAELKRHALNDQLEAAINGITESKEAIDSMQTAISNLYDITEKLGRTVSNSSVLNRINGQYTSELAQLVTVLAEGLRDQHLDGNITRAVEKYRTFESETLKSMVTGDSSGPRANSNS